MGLNKSIPREKSLFTEKFLAGVDTGTQPPSHATIPPLAETMDYFGYHFEEYYKHPGKMTTPGVQK